VFHQKTRPGRYTDILLTVKNNAILGGAPMPVDLDSAYYVTSRHQSKAFKKTVSGLNQVLTVYTDDHFRSPAIDYNHKKKGRYENSNPTNQLIEGPTI
jgi:hypothetical protein